MWKTMDPLISSMGLHDLGLMGKMLCKVVKFFNTMDYLMDNGLSEFQYKIVTDSLKFSVCVWVHACVLSVYAGMHVCDPQRE